MVDVVWKAAIHMLLECRENMTTFRLRCNIEVSGQIGEFACAAF